MFCLGPYMLILVFMLIIFILLVAPMVLVLMGVLLGVSRISSLHSPVPFFFGVVLLPCVFLVP